MLFVTRLQISQSTHHKLKMLASTNMHMELLLLRQPSLVDSNHVNKNHCRNWAVCADLMHDLTLGCQTELVLKQ